MIFKTNKILHCQNQYVTDVLARQSHFWLADQIKQTRKTVWLRLIMCCSLWILSLAINSSSMGQERGRGGFTGSTHLRKSNKCKYTDMWTTVIPQILPEISWFTWVFGLFLLLLCWLCCLKALYHWKNASTLMIRLGKKKLGTTSPWIFSRLVTRMRY